MKNKQVDGDIGFLKSNYTYLEWKVKTLEKERNSNMKKLDNFKKEMEVIKRKFDNFKR